jgi:AbrB family looped-hinge helix DNA binding protein
MHFATEDKEDRSIAHCRVNANGRIVIPAALRQQMGLQPGDAVTLTLANGVLQIRPHREVLREIQERMRQLVPDSRCLSEELIAERREEARREMAELDALPAVKRSRIA